MTHADPAVPARRAVSIRPPGGAALAAALDGLTAMNLFELQKQWRRLYRTHPPKKLSRELLALAVGWKLQAQALGGLSGTAARELRELAGSLDSRSDLPKARRARLKPGARLVREWGGEIQEVLVTEQGFVWRDRTWKSLSVIAREITGARWSGPRFFGLGSSSNAEPGHRRGEAAHADA